MTRTPTPPEGQVYVKSIFVPASLWAVAGEIGRLFQIGQEKGLEILLVQASTALAKRTDALGDFIENAWNRLLVTDRAPLDGLPPVDVTRLHRSNKTKSGFVGVYANGKGFRAMAKDPTGKSMICVGTFPTAERAAHARFMHYKKHKLPYGEVEEEIEAGREVLRNPDAPAEEALAIRNQIRVEHEGRPALEMFPDELPEPSAPTTVGMYGVDAPIPEEIQKSTSYQMRERAIERQRQREAKKGQ